ncbi:MAG: sialate O-acetylesterase [Bacteroidota bacterium]
MNKTRILMTAAFLLLTVAFATAEVKLPKVFTNNMVLQRDKPVKVWGWAAKGESVAVSFNGQQAKAKANNQGAWVVTLPAMLYGGPFDMTVTGKANTVTLKNILIGDVWICSGQSNMEWIIRNTNHAEKEIAESAYPSIRLFTVEKALSFTPKPDLAGGTWLECNPATIGDFSAVAYFFGRKLNKELNIPIGLINSSWGGTNIQTWTSWDVMSQQEEYKSLTPAKYTEMVNNRGTAQEKYAAALKIDKGMAEKWFDPAASVTGWKKIQVPSNWDQTEIGPEDGIVWFKSEFDVPADLAGKPATISLGPIDDWDETYINGVLVGKEYDFTKPRIYTLNTGLKAGKNSIIIKITDVVGGGGLYGNPEQLFVEVGGQKISLAGEWQYKPSVLSSYYGVKSWGPNEFPSQLYNAMIAPLTQYSLKGAIWYQGENNAYEAFKYRTLFPNLINDWRSKWGNDLSFYWVQLANFMKPADEPVESQWAELREAQTKTLSLPNTGQAVIIDIGEANDIHPRNKQDVGYRLALAALKTTYAKDIVYAGPIYQSMKIQGNKVLLSFSNTGSGLVALRDKYHYIRGFAIAGADKKFVWANAYLEGDQVVVSSDAVKNPVAVRYAWGDNPDDANLYNQEGLPATPFRTDDWKPITQK